MFADLLQKFAGKPRAEAEPVEAAPESDLPVSGGLKEKLAGLDKKRVYTAIGALIIAGVAGQIMQRYSHPQPVPVPHRVAANVTAPAQAAPQPDPAEVAIASPAPSAAATTPPARLALAEAGPASDIAAPQAVLPDPEVTRGDSAPILPMDNAPAMAALPTPTLSAPVADAAVPVSTAPAMAAPETTAPQAPVTIAAASDAGVGMPAPETAAPPADLTAACDVTFSAEAMPGALVALDLSAPCNSGEDVDFEQFGLRFSEQLDPEGRLRMQVPAMADDAIFVASFADGSEATADVQVPDFADYERVALVWKGPTGLQLHALENGAGYDDPGHLWAQAPGKAESATSGEGGFVSVLGSTASGYAADVYTYPESLMSSGSGPAISIEAEVMENTCGNTVKGSFLRALPGSGPSVTDVTMAVPGCDAVGEYLVLKNLPQDLKIARN